MMRVHSTCAAGASAIGVPGCPEFAFCTASIANPRMTLTPRCSSSSLTPAPFRHVVAAYVVPKAQTSEERRSGLEYRKGRGEAVQEVPTADRTEFAGAESARDRNRSE